ncbi:response regulator [Nitratireductor sp. CH_MIT9313-5]|uniref:response regulator n=1 Tax=Nitratireductor sp. CH_MIT9313-5 TaxID=3107764 RepID=UPI00300B2362
MSLLQKQQAERPLILCIEDEPDLRRDVAEELSEAGYSVLEAGDGLQALDLLDIACPDLILCDISMPGIDGYEVLEAVRAKGDDHAGTPFVFLTALADPREVVEGKRFGADDYLVKPIDYDLLLATIEARLRQVARLRSLQREPGDSISEAVLRDQFGLTAAEARVALTLTEGFSLAEVGQCLGVSRTTTAYHLRNIFQKTGARRQTELISILLRGRNG